MIEQKIHYTSDRRLLKRQLASIVKDVRRLFVVHGHDSYVKCGARDLVNELCETSLIRLHEFDEFTENPKKCDVDKGVIALEHAAPEVMMAIGGGSAMDMAKLIRFYSKQNVRLVALPTTAGTGAESTQFAVCYIDGVKYSISDVSILPDEVVLYPPFTIGNSRYLTSCTGFDALAQAIEAYWNIHATDESDECALKSIAMIYDLLPKTDFTEQDRESLLCGANLAGRAINITRTTVPHALSYTLTSKYGYPHGHAVALTFPFFVRYYMEGAQCDFNGHDFDHFRLKMKKLADVLRIESAPETVMRDYVTKIGLGFDPNRDFDDGVVARGVNLERAGNSPMIVNEKVLMAAVKSIRTLTD